jgi:hypothetical protein
MFEVPRLKVKRADALLDEFSTKAAHFLQSEPYSLLLVEDAMQFHLIGQVTARVPSELGLVLGDALHNLRASLDVLVNDAVCKQTGRSNRNASFPLAKDLDTFERGVAKSLPGASTALIDTIRNLQPFNSASPWLRRLHDFDIADKHRTSLPVLGNPAFHNIQARQRGTGGTMSLESVNLDAEKVGHVHLISVDKTMEFEFDRNVNHSFFFALSDDLASSGIDVNKAFSEMRKEVINSIETIEALCIKTAT